VLSTVKVITVWLGGALSLQYHRRDELWVTPDSGALVELEDRVLEPQRGERIFLRRETVHRLSATAEQSVRVLEVSFGEFDEDYIVRLEDVYGRIPAQDDAPKGRST
jgi:mannose-6-phosphate isomerase